MTSYTKISILDDYNCDCDYDYDYDCDSRVVMAILREELIEEPGIGAQG